MTKELQELKTKIQKLVPEIMELEFGCIFSDKSGGLNTLTKIVKCEENGFDKWFCNSGGGYIPSVLVRDVKGKPIGIREVLLALGKERNGEIMIDSTGEFHIWNGYRDYWEEQNVYWNLEDDNLEKQKSETINLLNEIL